MHIYIYIDMHQYVHIEINSISCVWNSMIHANSSCTIFYNLHQVFLLLSKKHLWSSIFQPANHYPLPPPPPTKKTQTAQTNRPTQTAKTYSFKTGKVSPQHNGTTRNSPKPPKPRPIGWHGTCRHVRIVVSRPRISTAWMPTSTPNLQTHHLYTTVEQRGSLVVHNGTFNGGSSKDTDIVGGWSLEYGG